MYNSVVLIPAFMPDKALLNLIYNLYKLKVDKIVVVRDGGGEEFDSIFAEISKLPYCHLVVHSKNMGKGVALKSGFKYILANFPNILGCVTADADGQHLSEDIVKVLKQQQENPNNVIVGARSFDKNVPFRSKIGNYITKILLSLVLWQKIIDSQSGLRAIPLDFMPTLIKLKGDTYEFELNMLLNSKRYGFKILQVGIETIYIENNRSSHFNPLIDSVKIYYMMIRYIFSSLFAFLLDYGLFLLIFYLGNNFLIAFLISRTTSLSINYYINKNVVFNGAKKSNLSSVIPYLSLVIINFIVVYFLISKINSFYNVNIPLLKIILEIIMFIINFHIQKKYIFNK
jgi:putative flippase GtrA